MGCDIGMPLNRSNAHLTDHDIDFILNDLTLLISLAILDRVKRTSYSYQDVIDWHQAFLKDCPRGYLDRKQFIELYRRVYPRGRPDLFCSHVFRTFDIDKNNQIDFKEFLLAHEATFHGSLDRRIEWLFNLYDVRQNGKIEKREMIKILTAMHELKGDTADNYEAEPELMTKTVFTLMESDKKPFIEKEKFFECCKRNADLRKILAPNF